MCVCLEIIDRAIHISYRPLDAIGNQVSRATASVGHVASIMCQVGRANGGSDSPAVVAKVVPDAVLVDLCKIWAHAPSSRGKGKGVYREILDLKTFSYPTPLVLKKTTGPDGRTIIFKLDCSVCLAAGQDVVRYASRNALGSHLSGCRSWVRRACDAARDEAAAQMSAIAAGGSVQPEIENQEAGATEKE
jgi:hypothetical protein